MIAAVSKLSLDCPLTISKLYYVFLNRIKTQRLTEFVQQIPCPVILSWAGLFAA